MPTHTEFDHAARLAVMEARGEVTPEEAVAQFRDVCAELVALHARDPERPYGVLVDTRGSGTVPTRIDVLRVLEEICAHPRAQPAARWAVLATKPALYGMSRLFQVHAEERQIEIEVFNARDEAVAWLTSRR